MGRRTGKPAEQLVREVLEVDPRPSATALAEATGLSRQTIYTLQKSMGFELSDGRTSDDAVGAVATDLRRRGAVVYRVSGGAPVVPIVADVAGELVRVAVQTRRGLDRYDAVAKVAKDGAVSYQAFTAAGTVLGQRRSPS